MTDTPLKLNLTSYCILGLVALHPLSAYEINRTIQNGTLKLICNRTKSQVFQDSKKLQQSGLLEGEENKRNGRMRTVYSITPQGEKELESWLSSQGAPLQVQSLSLAKLYLLDFEDTQRVHARLQGMKQELNSSAKVFRDSLTAFVEQGFLLSETAPIASCISCMGAELVDAQLEWIEKTERRLKQLEKDKLEQWTVENYTDAIDRLDKIIKKSESGNS